MILSVSRRTDIPAFYFEWFLNRLSEGYVLVRNPMNHSQVSKVMLSPSVIDCIVFWTKDPTNVLDKLQMLSGYKYYFQITVTGYGDDIEPNVRPKEYIVSAFRNLANRIGKEKTVWRYDPIILTDSIDVEYHVNQFGLLASQLGVYTERCIISFVDLYRKCERKMKMLNIRNISDQTMMQIGKELSGIARSYNIEVAACSEPVDLSSVSITHAKCVDDRLISRIIGYDISVQKDKNQRASCGCVTSIDIGAYDTCRHGCLYCYANSNEKAVRKNIMEHDPTSPFLIGRGKPGDRVLERKM